MCSNAPEPGHVVLFSESTLAVISRGAHFSPNHNAQVVTTTRGGITYDVPLTHTWACVQDWSPVAGLDKVERRGVWDRQARELVIELRTVPSELAPCDV